VNKKLFCSLMQSSVLAASLLCAAQGFAQEAGAAPETSAPAAGQGMGRGRGMMDPDQQLARMTQRYNLTTDQQTQIKPILASTQTQMQALRGDSSLSREDRMTKMMSIRSDTSSKIEAILNPDQKKQYEADQQKMMDRMKNGGGPGGPGGGGPPPQQ
jgi:periplasmic protein CpxP/Spy